MRNGDLRSSHSQVATQPPHFTGPDKNVALACRFQALLTEMQFSGDHMA